MGLISWHSGCQLSHTILTIPRLKRVEPSVDGIKLLDTGRFDETSDITIPSLQSQLLGSHSHLVASLIVEVAKLLVLTIIFAILSHTSHQVFSHFIMGMQKDVCLHHQQGIFGYALHGANLVSLLIFFDIFNKINALERLLDQQLIVLENRMTQHQVHSLMLRYTLLQTTRCQLHHQLSLTFLIGQLEIVSQHIVQNKLEVQGIGANLRATWHQIAF